ncbi:hypothetical protein ACMGDM_06620 [Sphingomonas sp. DT-51]|uniref:hypothetical protein n=1 Tax=Sphingomonas sp. DT-51 TaxID=3396165 RepID=UPI003F1C71C5
MFARSFRGAPAALTTAALMLLLAAPGSAATPPAGKTKPAVAPSSATAKAAVRKPKAKQRGKRVASTPVAPIDAAPRSETAERIIAWVAAARDNGKLPYAVIDKPAATLYLFAANGDFLGQAPVLLGIGVGDDSSPGVGAKNLDDIGPAERTTPAGRFVSKFGRAFGKQRVLWVDYSNAVALHAVTSLHKNEHRVERLLSPTPDDNRISFGCINVGARFYNGKLRPLFEKKGGVVYITPDVKPLDEVFPRVRLLPYLAANNAASTGAAH